MLIDETTWVHTSFLDADCASINSLGFDEFNSIFCCSTFALILVINTGSYETCLMQLNLI